MKKFTLELDETNAENFFESLNRLSWDIDTELIDIEFQSERGETKVWSEFIGDYTYPLKERYEVVKEQKDIVDEVITQLLVQLDKPQ